MSNNPPNVGPYDYQPLSSTATTTKQTTSTAPFVGLIDEILAQLPLGDGTNLILNWGTVFATNGYIPDPIIVEMIGTITTLDLHNFKALKEDTFSNLVHLPFSSSLSHLDLSSTPIGRFQTCIDILADPIFRHLVSLDLKNTEINQLDRLTQAPHEFSQLHTLNLSDNFGLSSIPQIATTTKFPNLKVLDLSGITLDTATIEAFAQPSSSSSAAAAAATSSSSTTSAPFLLEKFSLSSTNRICT